MTALDTLVAAVLDEVRRQAGADAAAVVRAESTALALTRFAASAVHQNVADERTTLHLQLTVDGGRTATASTTRTASAADLVTATLAAARLRPRDADWPGLGGPAPLVSAGNPDEATAQATPAERAAAVAAFVEAAGGLSTAGYVQTSASTAVLADTAGQHVRGAATSAACDGIARLGGADGVARSASRRFADLDPAALGARAAAKARAGVDAVPVEPGRYAVVLEPAAVGDLVAGLASGQFNGKAVVDGTSGLRLGEQQFDRAVSLVDDAAGPDATGLPFDTEGTPARRTELVRDGVPVGLTTDRRVAAALGGSSTGHASDVSATTGPVAGDPALAAGDGGSVDDLVTGLERGLLISDLWYTRVVDPKRSVWTGLTRNGVWLVEDGRVVAPVSTLRFTQSYLEALAPGAVTVGSVVDPQPARLTMTYAGTNRLAVPALRLSSWNITGNTTG
ncbi:Peptidase U62 modulator of DNA gyrase [Modestobacter italicus]|uniref:Peptidase U62 modulator of DNA gyrase n=1 Tax=Modestobacter italicus (strain DSM 44449 / CECT 9708 / BC 501) TaxID=2732864 RepID=I4ET64_MODI5|nr:metallopeptidase TldD-related protein [Modestobacter marinus]CCH86577.1 Peptidase U62 modulator of DNA gyrase [Modestobacter marinus]